MNKVCIFGGTGFIGLSLAEHLKERGLIPVIIGRNKPDISIDHEFYNGMLYHLEVGLEF